MKELPADVVAYKRTKSFNQNSVPDALKNDHTTKAGVWGKLHIESGKLIYVVTEPGEEESTELDSSRVGIIVPEQKHHVRIDEDVEFYVEFYK